MDLPTLQSILQTYFGCEKPFDNNLDLSVDGGKAYAQLISLLYDVQTLTDCNMGEVVDTLDMIVNKY